MSAQSVAEWAAERGAILVGPPGNLKVARKCATCSGSGRVPGARKGKTKLCECAKYRLALGVGLVPA